MSKIVRLPARLRLVEPAVDALIPPRPRYAAFVQARKAMFERLREMVGSDELSRADLDDEINATASVMRSVVALNQSHT